MFNKGNNNGRNVWGNYKIFIYCIAFNNTSQHCSQLHNGNCTIGQVGQIENKQMLPRRLLLYDGF